MTDLKVRCPLPVLMKHLGLEQHIKSSCRSPFRSDKNPSWGIYEHSGNYYWKDFGTGEGGDEISFLAKYLRVDKKENFQLLLDVYLTIASTAEEADPGPKPAESSSASRPDQTGYGVGTDEQIQKLSILRSISVEGLRLTQDRGLLVFGLWHGFEVFGVKDQSGRVLEIRMLNGKNFPEEKNLLERKCHAIKGSQKSWPVGIEEAKSFPSVALVEGMPDLLAAHDLLLREQPTEAKCAPVAILSAAVSIAEDALPLFKAKKVVIYPHVDSNGAGFDAAERWLRQLQPVAQSVKLFDFSKVAQVVGGQMNDLNDFTKLDRAALLEKNSALQTILPST